MPTFRKQTDDPLDFKNALANYYKPKAQPVTDTSGNAKQTMLEDYASVQNNLNNLFLSKYGAGNYGIGKGWLGQTANPLSNWTDKQETLGISEYNKYVTDMGNSQAGMNEWNLIKQNQAQAQGEAGVIKEQAEKYLPQQLQLQGLGKVGSSEKPIGGINNDYANLYNTINKSGDTQVSDLLGAYKTALSDSQTNFQNEQYDTKAQYQDAAYTAFNNSLSGYENKEQFLSALGQAKGQVTNDQYNALVYNATQLAKELGFDLFPVTQPTNPTTPENPYQHYNPATPTTQVAPVTTPTTKSLTPDPNNHYQQYNPAVDSQIEALKKQLAEIIKEAEKAKVRSSSKKIYNTNTDR